MSDILGAVLGLVGIWLGWQVARRPPEESPRHAMLERQPDRSARGEWRLTGGGGDFRQARRAYWFLSRIDRHHHRHRRL